MAIDNATLQEQLASLPDSERWATRPEVSDLVDLLSPGEQILTGVTALVKESGKLAVRTWLVIATNQRLICLLRSGAAVRKLETPIHLMKAAYTDARLGYHEVHVESSMGKLIISGTAKEASVELCSILAARMKAQQQQPAAEVVTVKPVQLTGDVQHQIQQLVAELESTKKRLAVVEEVLRRAAARNQAAKANEA